ncbi:hypothetical protein [Crassaminicella profunda]|uniref:hypothetical protein n=1 Tax=Crassaminicella profunda TaxID=1286698 RepID=UPI001CA6EC53|nr:hypothetical protein [Crassaminicella profunda]QZY53784.1 hypothetical protein K7H06_12015 [Crassaminicella profunda]
MNLIKEVLKKAAKQMGEHVKLEKVLIKTGRLAQEAVDSAESVLGFDYLIEYDNKCFEFYVANPPLIGMTQPTPVKRPLGIASFADYKIDYKSAIKIFHSGDWGSKFTSIVLSKPLTPEVTEPYWYFRSDLGVDVIIGANTGKVHHPA